MNVLRKKTVWTQVTPIPSFVPRQLAVDLLHSHEEIIRTNPLVLDVKPTQAPRDAPADEFYATWYEIFERIQVVPGLGKFGSSKISFKTCFHDMPWGVQTHSYAPLSIDLRNKWQICGTQPGEPAVQQELGIGAPAEGLYLREDIEVKCNVSMIGVVKKDMKAASKVMVDRMMKKAELLDSGALQAMFEDGKLKTINPADRTKFNANLPMQPPMSPSLPYQSLRSGHPNSPQGSMFPGQQQQQQAPPQQAVVMELPGDMYHAQSQGHLQPNDNRYSTMSNQTGQSPNPSEGNWDRQGSVSSSRPTSYSSDGMRSPPAQQQQFMAELPTHAESDERSSGQRPVSQSGNNKHLEAGNVNPYQPYNPQRHSSYNSEPPKWQEVQRDSQQNIPGRTNLQ